MGLVDYQKEYKDLKLKLEDFLNKNGRFPFVYEITNQNGFNKSYDSYRNICKNNNTTFNELCCDIDCFKASKPSVRYYTEYANKLKNLLVQNDTCNIYTLCRNNKECPEIRWLINNCPDKNVKNSDDLKKYLGMFQTYLSKEDCISQIYKMRNELKRPLMYDDFRGVGYGKVSVKMVRDYWGTLNKMKIDLNLEIVQESMTDKKIDIDIFNKEINLLEKYYCENNRSFISTKEIDSLDFCHSSSCLREFCKSVFNKSLKDYLCENGIIIGNNGEGLVYDFSDGEKTVSQWEYLFSKYLRNIGLEYNKDYFRDIKYNTLDNNYKGNMNIDYEIHINNKIIYIEIAGLLDHYKQWYYSDKEITNSKSKNKYRLKLKEKERMLNSNNLIYFILFPCDLTIENFNNILNYPTIKLRKEIEIFYCNNIDWVKIQELGMLKYKENELSVHGNKIVDYETS